MTPPSRENAEASARTGTEVRSWLEVRLRSRSLGPCRPGLGWLPSTPLSPRPLPLPPALPSTTGCLPSIAAATVVPTSKSWPRDLCTMQKRREMRRRKPSGNRTTAPASFCSAVQAGAPRGWDLGTSTATSAASIVSMDRRSTTPQGQTNADWQECIIPGTWANMAEPLSCVESDLNPAHLGPFQRYSRRPRRARVLKLFLLGGGV